MSQLEQNPNMPEFSVSEISNTIKLAVEGAFPYVRVKGELSNFKRAPSGHLYFNLKDESAVLAGICWKGSTGSFTFKPEDGIEVVCTGRITTYAGQSKYQMIVESMTPAGLGALMELLEKRKKKLAAEGLFDADRKKPIPYLPKIIGVVTSPTGAVIRDILHRIEDRFPTHVIVWPVLVQGEKAAEQIANAIYGFNAVKGDNRPDLLIVARGGGSLEDLWAFNEEIVVRAAAASDIPLISAVGHETDTTLIDYVSDLRCPTPTAAAEKAVPVKAELVLYIDDMARRIKGDIFRLLENKANELKGLARGMPSLSQLIDDKTQKLDNLAIRLENAFPKILKDKEQKIHFLGKLMESYSYKNVLKRGFAVVHSSGGKVISQATGVNAGDKLKIEFADGQADVQALGNKSKKTVVADKRQDSLF
ncbi:MAG: exodeoxyribonuclease VII large subunit [Rickettsiales bacterium]|nr:exodeoxyribonuclease VII large subunit [Pseudomonadota bacterium]MDA0965670.1 exodeoxyribonuclease VII large subunit [Pseudomonadota bacterium]MDG4542994.1 exodeoxyribonuclease VII large subunit [Rickettsiales bacterium]MDG4544558.1 exodeoxyribonuclease VII large subunit [Rickettsiales bacterium]MDG4546680.1 exodeoxyribonuclease VII large subunit [Rickettsiales bacterium]